MGAVPSLSLASWEEYTGVVGFCASDEASMRARVAGGPAACACKSCAPRCNPAPTSISVLHDAMMELLAFGALRPDRRLTTLMLVAARPGHPLCFAVSRLPTAVWSRIRRHIDAQRQMVLECLLTTSVLLRQLPI